MEGGGEDGEFSRELVGDELIRRKRIRGREEFVWERAVLEMRSSESLCTGLSINPKDKSYLVTIDYSYHVK